MKDPQRRSLRVGAAVIFCAVVLRLMSGGVLQPLLNAAQSPEAVSFLMYLETGRVLPKDTQPPETTDPEPVTTAPAEADPGETLTLTGEEVSSLDIRYDGDYRPDLEQLLLEPLDWNLRSEEPTVLILHTHTTESYTRSDGEAYTESSAYRTLDEGYNMLSIGDRVAELLEAGGVKVIHDRTLHDYPSYNGSYMDAREAMERCLEQYPTVQLVLDLHRDAAEDGDGQMDTSAQVGGRESAQLMLVVGTDEGGLEHPEWQENLSLALKLMAVLEQENEGICRPLGLRTERFNQDLSPGALLIEVGAAGNTHPEALTAAQALAEAILLLADGWQREN